MNVRTEFPRAIREIENVWIPLSDGCRLAARIWLPEDAEDDPVPAILEYIPYRKNDGTAPRDAPMHPYFAGYGYAAVRVDLRGSGESGGILRDEYLPQEQEDALQVIAWIANQTWCTGKVGMMGISWGGFNSLQVAAHRPPALKAIITIDSTDDRYADDVHYMGGCVLGVEMLEWASSMLAYNAMPPDPAHVGERWREMWLDRLEQTPAFIEQWLRHQRRDDYWKQGSVCEDYDAITCAVYAIGGWNDGYTNAVPRLLEGLSCPRKGLIGPWGHAFPHDAAPGPSIGFLQHALRWWDHWLKDEETGIMDEPMLRVWMQESVAPKDRFPEWKGRWVAERAWPSPRIETQTLWLTQHGLAPTQAPEAKISYTGSEAAGHNAGMWCPYGFEGDLPPDQRAEDGLSLTFTSPPAEGPVEILGVPEVTLSLSVDKPNALIAVRLCDVAPDGTSLLVSRGLLNLTHRDSHEFPELLEPGTRYTVTVRLNVIGHSLPAGHRWRVAISPTYWPHAWPSPHNVTLTVYAGERSRLVLPVRPPRPEDETLPAFEEPEGASPLEVETVRSSSRNWQVRQDLAAGTYQVVDHYDGGAGRLANNGIEYEDSYKDTYTIVDGDPLSARVTCERVVGLGRGDWQTRIETTSTMSADARTFYVTNVLDAYEGDTRIFTDTKRFAIPRDHV